MRRLIDNGDAPAKKKPPIGHLPSSDDAQRNPV